MRDEAYREEGSSEGRVYWWNRLIGHATDHTPTGCVRQDVAVLAEEGHGAVEAAALLATGSGDGVRSDIQVCRSGGAHVVLLVGSAIDEDLKADAYIVVFGAGDSFGASDSASRALTDKALRASAGRAPVLLVASPRSSSMPSDIQTRARVFAAQERELGRPVECASSLSDAAESAAALAALLERASALQAGGQKCIVQ